MPTESKQVKPARTYKCNPSNWVENYADYLYNYAITRINDEGLAQDLVQETFLAGLERIHKFEGRSSDKTWLTAILKNKIIDIYRKKSSGLLNKTTNQHALNDEVFFNADNGHWNEEHSPQAFGIEDEDVLGRKELNNILQMCMQKLPSLWLSVFTMKHIDDEDSAVICEELRITPANFWVIIHRAKVNLRACLQKNWI
jgi:RNA polymerase sigma-70 factor (ECF subfamily)